MGKTENKVAEARINKALVFIKEKFSQDLLDDNDEIIQNGVIVVMKIKIITVMKQRLSLCTRNFNDKK